MQNKADQVTLLRTLSAMLLVLAAGMIGARLFFGLELSFTLVIALITIGISNLMIARKVASESADKPD